MNRQYVDDIRKEIQDYLIKKGISPNKSFNCLNPEHEDKNPSMSLNKKYQNVHCFACGVTYDIFDLIGFDYNIINFQDKYIKACELFGYSNENNHITNNEDKTNIILELYSKRDTLSDYLSNRGISNNLIENYKIFEKSNRLYFPIYSDNKCTGWTSRSIVDSDKHRYINSQGIMGIWNSDYIKSDGNNTKIFVTEGIIDALSIEEHGQNALAVCGASNGRKFLSLCEKFINTAKTWNIVLCGDPDDSGKKMVQILYNGLTKLGINVSKMDLEPCDGDINDLHINNPDKLKQLMENIEFDNNSPINSNQSYTNDCASEILDIFLKDCVNRGKIGGISTGFKSLDKILDGGLYSGLYVIGAVSSLGKTSFMLQIADYISQQNNDVIYISLEQSKFELIAKSLTRIISNIDSDENKANSLTIRDIMSYKGKSPELLNQAKKIYLQGCSSLFLKEGLGNINAVNIREMVQDHINNRQKNPIIIVDYLQILSPISDSYTDKQNIDRSIVELKRISRDFDIPVLVISSFNRENYKYAVSMESFKESGAVEYSSDVLLGLQLKGVGTRDFDINGAKQKIPRELEVVLLKNRNGIPYSKISMKYDPRFNYIYEDTKSRIKKIKDTSFLINMDIY